MRRGDGGVTLEGKVAAITGGGSGLGAAIAGGFVREGARVVLADRDADAVARVAAPLGDACRTIALDVTDADAPERVVGLARSAFGRLDVVVPAAGIHGRAPVAEITPEGFDRTFAVNVRAPFLLVQAALPLLEGGGAVIFIGSTAATAAMPGGFSAYCSTKGAVRSLVRALAVELAPLGVRVNEIAPGAFDTPIYDTIPPNVKQGLVDMTLFPKRFGRASEFAMLVEELIRNPMHNGRTYRFDGGAILAANP